MSAQKLRAEICRPGILLQLHQAFPGRGAHCPPKCFLSHQRLLSAMSILRERLPSFLGSGPRWALGRELELVTSHGVGMVRVREQGQGGVHSLAGPLACNSCGGGYTQRFSIME